MCSIIFLKKKLTVANWLGILTVVSGLVVVGVSDLVFDKQPQGNNHTGVEKAIGIGLILLGMIFTSGQVGPFRLPRFARAHRRVQVVYEERFIGKYNIPPLQAVGWEGIFGFLTLGMLLVVVRTELDGCPRCSSRFSSTTFRCRERTPDLRIDWKMCLKLFVKCATIRSSSSPPLVRGASNVRLRYDLSLSLSAPLGNIFSIAFFNFAGISVTKELSSTTRMVLDSGRTVIIWAVSLALSWQKFYALQILGFVLLVIGVFECAFSTCRRTIPPLQAWASTTACG